MFGGSAQNSAMGAGLGKTATFWGPIARHAMASDASAMTTPFGTAREPRMSDLLRRAFLAYMITYCRKPAPISGARAVGPASAGRRRGGGEAVEDGVDAVEPCAQLGRLVAEADAQ